MTTAQDQQSRAMVPGDELHLSLLMAPHGLNLVSGQDRAHLLAYARDVWQAARTLPADLKPVAEIYAGDMFRVNQGPDAEPVAGDHDLYTAAQVLAMGRVPPGWQAVPQEPPTEMGGAAAEAYMPFGDMALAIQEAIAAAPRPPAAPITEPQAPSTGAGSATSGAAPQPIVGPCGQCKDDREPCSCAIDTMLKERGQIAVNRERHLVIAKQAKAAQELKPLTPEQIHKWWASENGLEDCDMGKLIDFTTVVCEFESKLGIQ